MDVLSIVLANYSVAEDLPPRPPDRHGVRVSWDLVVRDAHGKITDRFHKDHDPNLLQGLQFYIAAILGVANGLSFNDTSNTAHVQTGQVLAGTVAIAFGLGSTTPTFSDFAVTTLAGGVNPVAATVSAIAVGGTSGSFTVTAKWSNTTGATQLIAEVAIYVTTTQGMAVESTFAITHDLVGPGQVSPNGTATATATFHWS